MKAAARDCTPIMASEVDVEQLFGLGRDILGVRRWAMSGDTMRAIMQVKDLLRRKKEAEGEANKKKLNKTSRGLYV
jgi:hypothetical protein